VVTENIRKGVSRLSRVIKIIHLALNLVLPSSRGIKNLVRHILLNQHGPRRVNMLPVPKNGGLVQDMIQVQQSQEF